MASETLKADVRDPAVRREEARCRAALAVKYLGFVHGRDEQAAANLLRQALEWLAPPK